MWVFAAVMAAAMISGSPLAAPAVERLDGARADLSVSSKPTIVLFWRSDCVACLMELTDLTALRASARQARVIPVGLQPSASLRPALARRGLPHCPSLRAF